MNKIKFIGKVLTILNICFILWIMASFADIVLDNTNTNPVHNEYNIFTMLF